MQIKGLILGTAIACLAIVPSVQSAFAACANAMASGAKWHLHAVEAGVDVGGASVIRCIATFSDNGAFTAPCKIFNVGSSTQVSATTHGTLNLSAQCDLTGSITIPGGDPKVVIKYGHVNGNVGSGIAIQGTGTSTQVLHLNVVKQ
jgi:hypothetical protein